MMQEAIDRVDTIDETEWSLNAELDTSSPHDAKIAAEVGKMLTDPHAAEDLFKQRMVPASDATECEANADAIVACPSPECM